MNNKLNEQAKRDWLFFRIFAIFAIALLISLTILLLTLGPVLEKVSHSR